MIYKKSDISMFASNIFTITSPQAIYSYMWLFDISASAKMQNIIFYVTLRFVLKLTYYLKEKKISRSNENQDQETN